MSIVGVDPSTEGRFYYCTEDASDHGKGLVGMGWGHNLKVVVVEVPWRMYARGRIAECVLDAAYTAGAVEGEWGVAPEEWRLWLCGKRSPSDAEVKAALSARLELPRCMSGMPSEWLCTGGIYWTVGGGRCACG
jgi:hypothetical protein